MHTESNLQYQTSSTKGSSELLTLVAKYSLIFENLTRSDNPHNGSTIESNREHHVSLQPQAQYSVPIETANVARTVFPQGNLCMTMSERLSEFIDDETFSHLFEAKGQTAESPWRLSYSLWKV